MVEDEQDTSETSELEWEHRNFRLTSNMKKVCEATIKATESEIQRLKQKMRKLQYGSNG